MESVKTSQEKEVEVLMDYKILNEHKEAIQFLGYLNGGMKDNCLDEISKKANREILDNYYLHCIERLSKWHLSFQDIKIVEKLKKISKKRINQIIDNYISAQAGNKIEDRMTLGEYEFATNMLERLNYLITSACGELNIANDVFQSSLSTNKRENINNPMNDIKQQDPELYRSLNSAAKEYLRAKTQIIRRKKSSLGNQQKNDIKQSIMLGNYRHLNLNTQINKPKNEINNNINNINNINYSKDDEEDKKEESKDNINENLNIEREQSKFKKIDVKKSGRKNYRESNIIIDNNNDLNEIHGKTVIISSNSKHDDELNPKTTITIRKKKVNKNIANQSMIVPNNMTSHTNVGGNRKVSDIMQNMLSKKSINKQNDNNINNNI